MTSQQIFQAKVRELIAQSHSLAPAARKQVIEMLDAARKKIIGDLANMDPGRFQTSQLQGLKLSIDQAMQDFGRQASQLVQASETQSALNGAATVTRPVEAVLGPMPLGRVSQTTLSIAQGYTADLITALSKTAAANVNAAIQRSFLGGQSMTDIIEQIGRAIGKGKFDGLFGPIGERATTIAENEILRVHSISAQARLEELSARHPDLQKQWFHINAARRPRMTHILASGQVTAVDEAFEVAGEELMYPRDPGGSAWNTINCHCIVRPYFSDEALQSTDADKGLLGSLGISVQVTHAA